MVFNLIHAGDGSTVVQRIYAYDFTDAAGAALGLLVDSLGELGRRLVLDRARELGELAALWAWNLDLVEVQQGARFDIERDPPVLVTPKRRE